MEQFINTDLSLSDEDVPGENPEGGNENVEDVPEIDNDHRLILDVILHSHFMLSMLI